MESHPVTSQSNLTAQMPMEIVEPQPTSLEFSKSSLSSKSQMSCWSKITDFISSIFSQIWSLFTWVFFCSRGSSRSEINIEVTDLLNKPTQTAKKFAANPLKAYAGLLNSISKNPKFAQNILSQSDTKKKLKSFKIAFKKEMGNSKFQSLRKGKGDLSAIISAAQANEKELSKSFSEESQNKLKQLQQIQQGMKSHIFNIMKVICKQLLQYVEENSLEESDKVKTLKKSLKEIKQQASSQTLPISQKSLEKCNRKLFSPLKLQQSICVTFCNILLNSKEKTMGPLLSFLSDNAHIVDKGLSNFQFNHFCQKILYPEIAQEINTQIIPKLQKFLKEDHPLLSIKLEKFSNILVQGNIGRIMNIKEAVKLLGPIGLKI